MGAPLSQRLSPYTSSSQAGLVSYGQGNFELVDTLMSLLSGDLCSKAFFCDKPEKALESLLGSCKVTLVA